MAGKGRPPICRICGSQLNYDSAYKVTTYTSGGKEKNAFYCSQEEYENNILATEKKQEKKTDTKKKRSSKKTKDVGEKVLTDKDKAYQLICRIIGRSKIVNTILWKEWKVWNDVATNEVILRYLTENELYLTTIISNLDNIEYNRIRYLSAVLKNKLGDYQITAAEIKQPKIQIDESFYSPIATRNNKRRSLEDLEDDF